MTEIQIRDAAPEDVPAILSLVRALAEFEKHQTKGAEELALHGTTKSVE